MYIAPLAVTLYVSSCAPQFNAQQNTHYLHTHTQSENETEHIQSLATTVDGTKDFDYLFLCFSLLRFCHTIVSVCCVLFFSSSFG